MPHRRTILLTGATGFLGRHLLHDLRSRGHPVAVLVRPEGTATATQRLTALLASRSGAIATTPPPVALTGDLTLPDLGLSASDRAWLSANCPAVLHAAASVRFRSDGQGEPHATNVEGTRRLADLCANLGLREFHYISTAFVCGDRRGPVLEDELDQGQGFHNVYEQSKFEAERVLGGDGRLRLTVYRPSVIVGDSRTGATTSYQGLYRVFEVGDRAARPVVPGGLRRSLSVALPFRGDEAQDLVPVDWVAQAIVRLLERPAAHGRTYHVTAANQVPLRVLGDVAAEALAIDGVEWAGPETEVAAGSLEQALLDMVGDHRPYLTGAPVFDRQHLLAFLPDLPAPAIDHALLVRLMRYAARDRWGRRRCRPAGGRSCTAYFEDFFPRQPRRSPLAQTARLNLVTSFAIDGAGGGSWSIRWKNGDLVGVERGQAADAVVHYRTDAATFEAIVSGRQAPQEAFFEQRITIEGDIETGLKLAVLFAQFVRQFPYPPARRSKIQDAAA